jgi:hypothetical protein
MIDRDILRLRERLRDADEQQTECNQQGTTQGIPPKTPRTKAIQKGVEIYPLLARTSTGEKRGKTE